MRPTIAAEFEDSALMKVFGQAGRGVFPAPTVVAAEVARQYHVVPIGEAVAVRERFYAISPERRIKHPAVAHLIEAAKKNLFS